MYVVAYLALLVTVAAWFVAWERTEELKVARARLAELKQRLRP